MAIVALTIGHYVKVVDHFPVPQNPLALWSALRLAALLVGMVVLVNLAQYLFGHWGMQVVVFLGGLVDMNGVILAIATLYQKGQLSAAQAINNLGIAVLASFVSKYVITWSLIRNHYATLVSLFMTLMVLLYVAAWVAISMS